MILFDFEVFVTVIVLEDGCAHDAIFNDDVLVRFVIVDGQVGFDLWSLENVLVELKGGDC